MMHEIFSTTAPHGKIWIKEDPARLIRRGYNLDSKLARIKLFPNRISLLPYGFIALKPEGPNNIF